MTDYEPNSGELEAIDGALAAAGRIRQEKWRERVEFEALARAWLVGKAPGNEYAQFILNELEELDSYRKDI